MIERVKHIKWLDILGLPRKEYILAGSIWLAIMRIRDNKDIDIIISSKLREKYSSYLSIINTHDSEKIKGLIDISRKHERRIVDISKAKNVDELISQHHVNIDGYQVVSFKLFKKYKKPRKGLKHKEDRKAMSLFLKQRRHLLPEYKGIF